MDLQGSEWLCLVLDLHSLIILIYWLMSISHMQGCAVNESVCLLWNPEFSALPLGWWSRIQLYLFSLPKRKNSEDKWPENCILISWWKSIQVALIWDPFCSTMKHDIISKASHQSRGRGDGDIKRTRLSLKIDQPL